MKLLLTALITFLGSTNAQEDAVKEELARMAGDWRLSAGEEDGEAVPDYVLENLQCRIADKELTFKGIEPLVDRAAKLTITLDPAGKPKCIDLKVVSGSDKGVTYEGIYEWRGDELRMCLAIRSGVPNRPLEFATKAGSSCVLMTLKRSK